MIAGRDYLKSSNLHFNLLHNYEFIIFKVDSLIQQIQSSFLISDTNSNFFFWFKQYKIILKRLLELETMNIFKFMNFKLPIDVGNDLKELHELKSRYKSFDIIKKINKYENILIDILEVTDFKLSEKFKKR